MTRVEDFYDSIMLAINLPTVMPHGFDIADVKNVADIATSAGISQDADMVVMASIHNDLVMVCLVIGRSVRFGVDLRTLLMEYFSYDQDEYDRIVDDFTRNAAERFVVGDTVHALVLRNSVKDVWRSFRLNTDNTLPNMAEVRERAKQSPSTPKKRLVDPSVN